MDRTPGTAVSPQRNDLPSVSVLERRAKTAKALDFEDCRAIVRLPCSRDDAIEFAAWADRVMVPCQPEDAVRMLNGLMIWYDQQDKRSDQELEVYSAGMSALFAAYPAVIGKKAIDPVNGLPSRLKYVPKPADLKEVLEAEMVKLSRRAANARWVIGQHVKAEQEAREREEFERNRGTYEEREAKVRAALAKLNRVPAEDPVAPKVSVDRSAALADLEARRAAMSQEDRDALDLNALRSRSAQQKDLGAQ